MLKLCSSCLRPCFSSLSDCEPLEGESQSRKEDDALFQQAVIKVEGLRVEWRTFRTGSQVAEYTIIFLKIESKVFTGHGAFFHFQKSLFPQKMLCNFLCELKSGSLHYGGRVGDVAGKITLHIVLFCRILAE